MRSLITIFGCLIVAFVVLQNIDSQQVQSPSNSDQQVDSLAEEPVGAEQSTGTIKPKPNSKSTDDPTVFVSGRTTKYDPLGIAKAKIKTLDLTFRDTSRKRDVPLLVYLPKSTKPAAVIVHSHGLGGTKNTSSFLGKHWAARGFVAVFVQHPGSDDSIWVDLPKWKRLGAFKRAANHANLKLRVGDVSALIDQLEKWNAKKGHALEARMDLDHIGMSGHSFGAVTTQQIAGQTTFGGAAYADDRVSAAILMSPSSPRIGGVERAFGKIEMPWLCMTGTHDTSVIGGASVKSRLAVYPALPAGDKYHLVLKNAEHSVFTENKIFGDKLPRNPNHHKAIKAISTAFWDSYLRKDDAAKQWLNSAVRSVLEADDQWETK